MTFPLAHKQYLNNIMHAYNLVAVHEKAGLDAEGHAKRGKRGAPMSVNRAIVLMAVATWQATIEDLTLAAFALGPNVGNQKKSNALLTEVEKFSTPATHQVRGLFARNIFSPDQPQTPFDPAKAWNWQQAGGRGAGRSTHDAATIANTLDSWTHIRHAVAHGHDDLFGQLAGQKVCDVSVGWESHSAGCAKGVPLKDPALAVSRQARAGKNPSLTLADARQCLHFFERLTRVTANSLIAHVGAQHHGNTKLPWRYSPPRK